MFFAQSTLLFSLLLLLGGVAIKADELRITTAEELITFSNDVSSGNRYSGTTVYLDSDIDFTPSLSQQFQPIGKNETLSFQGTFDGQGHTISNLALNSSSLYVGLFGYSIGATIKNVVVDDSCSVVGSINPSSDIIEIGSVSGYCEICLIENVVSMASVSFAGSTNSILFMGGIAGRITFTSTIRNAVNYGPVAHSGFYDEVYCDLGGIAGSCQGYSIKYIQNCANYGTITNNGRSANLYVGGIVGGSTGETIIENCVSGGSIVNLTKARLSNYIGSVEGYIDSGLSSITTIAHCFWTSDVGCSNAWGSGNATATDSSLKELTKETVDGLNEYAEKNSTWTKWFMLHLNGGRISNLTQEDLVVTQKHFPEPAKEGNVFLFWCKENTAECSEVYDPKIADITGITDLYASYQVNNYTITFDFGSGTKATKTVTYGENYGALPEPEKAGYTFNGWFTEANGGEKIESITLVKIPEDHTLYAHWSINNYTITFNPTGGSYCEPITKNYNTKIVLPEPNKTGYSFDCWCSDPELGTEYTETTMPAENLTLYAKWSINNYTITFIFNNGKENEVRTLNFNETIIYPENLTREGFIFSGWSPEPEAMPAEDITVTAQWSINNYTITFIFNNGKENEVRVLSFNETIVYPENLTREGFIFNGWSQKPERMPAENITVTAQWVKVTPELVEIVFGKKDLKEDEIKEIIKEYTQKKFTIEKIEVDEMTEGTKVIVKFEDRDTAEQFYRRVMESSGMGDTFVRVGFVDESNINFKSLLCPLLLNYIFI